VATVVVGTTVVTGGTLEGDAVVVGSIACGFVVAGSLAGSPQAALTTPNTTKSATSGPGLRRACLDRETEAERRQSHEQNSGVGMGSLRIETLSRSGATRDPSTKPQIATTHDAAFGLIGAVAS
jgi:K+-transporting ATPase c subunit